MKTWTHLLILCCQGHLNKPLSGKTKIIQVFSWCFIFHDTASSHTMKDATGVPPERPFIYVSGAWRKIQVTQQEGASRNDIWYLTNWVGGTQALPTYSVRLYCMSIRREDALAHSCILHCPSLVSTYNRWFSSCNMLLSMIIECTPVFILTFAHTNVRRH